jgi:hypothetical protein
MLGKHGYHLYVHAGGRPHVNTWPLGSVILHVARSFSSDKFLCAIALCCVQGASYIGHMLKPHGLTRALTSCMLQYLLHLTSCSWRYRFVLCAGCVIHRPHVDATWPQQGTSGVMHVMLFSSPDRCLYCSVLCAGCVIHRPHVDAAWPGVKILLI